MIAHIINKNGITMFCGGAPKSVAKEHVKYNEILDALREGFSEEGIEDILSSHDEAEKHGFDIDEGKYEGESIHPVLVQTLLNMEDKGLPMVGMVEFCKNLSKNPFEDSVEQLFDFMEYKDLPITEDGCLIAYKGVGDDDWSIRGNKDTVVVQGQVDERGRIKNVVGEVIEVLPSQVDNDRNRGCSYGLHVGSYDYAQNWGRKLYVVKVNPKDVVSVPTDCSCQKCRVCKYTVLLEIALEIEGPLVGEHGDEVSETDTEWGSIKNAINEVLEDFSDSNFVSFEDVIGRLQDRKYFYIDRTKIIIALNDLGWAYDHFGIYLNDDDYDDDYDDDDYDDDDYDDDDDDDDDDYDDDDYEDDGRLSLTDAMATDAMIIAEAMAPHDSPIAQGHDSLKEILDEIFVNVGTASLEYVTTVLKTRWGRTVTRDELISRLSGTGYKTRSTFWGEQIYSRV